MPKSYVLLEKNGDPRINVLVRKELEDSFLDFYESSEEEGKNPGDNLENTYWLFLRQYYRPSPTTRSEEYHTRIRVGNVRKLSPPGVLYRNKDIVDASDNDILVDLAEEVAIAILSSEFKFKERNKSKTISTARGIIFDSLSKLIQLSKEHAEIPDGNAEKHELSERMCEEIGTILANKESMLSVRTEGDADEFNRPFANGLTALSFYLSELIETPQAVNYMVVKQLVLNDATLNMSEELTLGLAKGLHRHDPTFMKAKTRGIIRELHKAGLEIFIAPRTRTPLAMSTEKRAEFEKEQRRLEEQRRAAAEEIAKMRTLKEEKAKLEAERKQQEELEEKARAERATIIAVRARDAARRKAAAIEQEKMAALRAGVTKAGGEPVVVQVRRMTSFPTHRSFSFTLPQWSRSTGDTSASLPNIAGAGDSGGDARPVSAPGKGTSRSKHGRKPGAFFL